MFEQNFNDQLTRTYSMECRFTSIEPTANGKGDANSLRRISGKVA